MRALHGAERLTKMIARGRDAGRGSTEDPFEVRDDVNAVARVFSALRFRNSQHTPAT
jgi:hypothetical protein